MIAAPRKMRSQAPLVYSQSFIWQLPRVVTALRWPNESAASPPFAGIRLAALLRSRSVARSRTRCGSRSSPCLIPHRLTTLASAASVSGSESDTAISGIVPATRMRIRPLYTRHQWATCSSVSCVVRLCPLLLPSNGVVLNLLKFYQNSNTVGCRRRGGTGWDLRDSTRERSECSDLPARDHATAVTGRRSCAHWHMPGRGHRAPPGLRRARGLWPACARGHVPARVGALRQDRPRAERRRPRLEAS